MQRYGIIAAALVFALAAAGGSAAAAPPASPSPAATAQAAATPTPDPAVVARAKSFFHMLQTGKIDRSQLSAQMLTVMTPEKVAQAAAQLGPYGDPVTFEQVRTGTLQGSSYYVYLLAFGDSTKLAYTFAVDGQGKVSGLTVAPAPSAP